MAGNIFCIGEDNKILELSDIRYDSEADFQAIIEKYPNILAGDQITPDNPRKWILVSREIGIPGEANGSNQLFLDHLFIDQDAVPTFVEVKRCVDTRIRREVVAQMLDYASNATAYWDIETIKELFYKRSDLDYNTLSNLDIASSEAEADYWDKVEKNLRIGKLRLMFVADEIPSSLRQIIEFLNNQMTMTEVLGLEIKQFLSEGIKVLVPRVIGQTTSAMNRRKSLMASWEADSFFRETERISGNEARKVAKNLHDLFKDELSCRIWWGQAKNGSFVPVFDAKESHQLISCYNTATKTLIELQFQYFKAPFDTVDSQRPFLEKFRDIGIIIPVEKLRKRPSFEWSKIQDGNAFDRFIDIFKEMLHAIVENDANTKQDPF